MNTAKIYNLSYKYLLNLLPIELKESDLEKYFVGDNYNYSSLKDIFERLIISAQNYQGMPNYIKFDNRKDNIKKLLHDYNLNWIANQTPEFLYNLFENEYKFTSSKNMKFNSWYKWSCSIIDSAKFVNEFKTINEFRGFIAQFNYDLAIRTALPLLISTKIKGIGFALACDFLKELGYVDYVKPDIHLIDICYKAGLCEDRNEIKVFETMVKIADECKITPYKLDKIFWLICSGNYYIDKINIKGHKDEFIKYLKEEIL